MKRKWLTGKRVTGKRVTGKRVTGKRVTGKQPLKTILAIRITVNQFSVSLSSLPHPAQKVNEVAVHDPFDIGLAVTTLAQQIGNRL